MAAGSVSSGDSAWHRCQVSLRVADSQWHNIMPGKTNGYAGYVVVVLVPPQFCETAIPRWKALNRLQARRIVITSQVGCVPCAAAAAAAAPVEAADAPPDPSAATAAPDEAADAAPSPAAAAAPAPATAVACASWRPMPSPPPAPSLCKLQQAESAAQAEASSNSERLHCKLPLTVCAFGSSPGPLPGDA